MNTPQFTPPPVKRRVPTFAIVLIALFVLFGLIAVGLQLMSNTVSEVVGDRSTVLATEPVAAAAPVAPLAQPVSALPDALTGRLDHLDKSLSELTEKIGASIEAQTAIQSDVAALRERLDQEAAERNAAKVAATQRATSQRRRIAKQAPPAPSADVLSVDMWGGKPSVALRAPDGRVQFANTGDKIPGGGVIGAVQAAGQTVTIHQTDGSTSTAISKDRP